MVATVMPELLRKVAQYPEEWVLSAIDKHECESEWFPSLYHLVKHMQPYIDARKRRDDRNAQTLAARQFMAQKPMGSKLPEPDRKKIVADVLGYDPAHKTQVHAAATSTGKKVRHGNRTAEELQLQSSLMGDLLL